MPVQAGGGRKHGRGERRGEQKNEEKAEEVKFPEFEVMEKACFKERAKGCGWSGLPSHGIARNKDEDGYTDFENGCIMGKPGRNPGRVCPGR